MAPSPENDNTPKAPDKNEKTKGDKHGSADINKEKNKDFKTLNNLNDCELKDLLDEAITYKNPKDREGKSTLFKELLSQAEESERNARAASAGGSEQVRYCNTTAKRSKHRRKPNSISENVMHGGSLDNLAKEELFEVAHHLNRPKRTVSARQREGGSLPSNVNAGGLASYDPHFLEEARRKRTVKAGVGLPSGGCVPPIEAMDVDMETVSLLEHDSVAENFDKGPSTLELIENAPPQSAPKFTTKATLQVNVDDALHFNDLEAVEKKPFEIEQISAKVLQSKYSVYIPNYNPLNDAAKKVDENGNALHQNTTSKNKKKKIQSDKNVVSCVAAEKVEGHRSDIINDVKKLLEFIGENKPQGGATNKTNAHRSSKQLHKHTSEEGPRSSKKQRAQSSKGKENRTELKKSNSLGEISTANLDNFAFVGDDDDDQKNDGLRQEAVEVMLRAKKDSAVDKPRERRSWGNVEHPAMQNFYKNPSTENIETSSASDFRVVTKKKKTKKRRNSVSGSRRKTSTVASNSANSSKSDGDRASSPPVVRRKSTCSVPHSDRSNDSSDADSVHSLPIDASQRLDPNLSSEDVPISYADIARNSERKTPQEMHKKTSPDAKSANLKENSPTSIVSADPISSEAVRAKVATHQVADSPVVDVVKPTVQTTPFKTPPPDVHNIKSFPSIHAANNKLDRLPKAENKANNVRSYNNKFQQQGRQQNIVQCNNVVNVNRNSRSQSNDAANEDLEQQDDIQSDLSIIQSNEMETIQYNSQIMPTMQIPDVQTIEKIHFMSQPGAHMPPHLQQHVVPPQHVHIASHPHHLHHINHHHHHHHAISMVPMTDIFTNGRSPSAYTAVISHTPHQPGGVTYVKAAQAYEGVGVAYIDHAYLPAPKGVVKETVGAHLVPNMVETQNVINNNLVTVTTQTNNVEAKHNNSISGKTMEDENVNNCASTKQNKMKFMKKSHFHSEGRSNNSGNRDSSVPVSHSVAKSSHTSPAPTVIANSDASSTSSSSGEGVNRQVSAPAAGAESESSDRDASSANCDSRTNASECASSEDSSRPPVVILSGLNSSKEVTAGLVFGFDVNEQLLSEDICENFVQRFVMPETFTATSHNHDKIVNYIGLAWDDVRKSHSLGKAQYYSETL